MTKIKLRRVKKVMAMNDFTLECEMENREVYKYDMSSIKNENGEMVEPLKKINYFKQVFVEVGYIIWPNGYSIDGTTISLDGELIKKTA